MSESVDERYPEHAKLLARIEEIRAANERLP